MVKYLVGLGLTENIDWAVRAARVAFNDKIVAYLFSVIVDESIYKTYDSAELFWELRSTHYANILISMNIFAWISDKKILKLMRRASKRKEYRILNQLLSMRLVAEKKIILNFGKHLAKYSRR